MNILHPATDTYAGIPGYVFGWLILIIALGLFGYIMVQRYSLLRSGQSDPRFSDMGKRLVDLVTYGFIQKRQPRYLWTGILHIMIFWGFVELIFMAVLLSYAVKKDCEMHSALGEKHYSGSPAHRWVPPPGGVPPPMGMPPPPPPR